MKKILAFVLSIVLLLGISCFAVSAVSESAGMDVLRQQFYADDSSPLDYVAYSPVKGEDDTTLYPLVVWLHGNSSGDYPGHQLTRWDCDIPLWASDEYQARFKSEGGAFLLLPRCPTGKGVLAWGIERKNDTKKTIDDFIEKNPNVDRSKIYIGGYSLGGKMVYMLASDYPDFFAAAFPMSATYFPTNSELERMGKMSVWLFTNVNDTKTPSVNYRTAVKPNWDYLRKHAANPVRCRITTIEKYYSPDGVEGGSDHNSWNAVIHDLFMNNREPFPTMKTYDGNGSEVSMTYPDGFISWLSEQSLENRTDMPEKQGFIQRILEIIRKLFALIFG